jgi:hypothetical protein
VTAQDETALVPTEADWDECDPDDVDVANGKRMFLGKTPAEAAQMFRENVLEHVDELRFMPARPFRFYVLVLADLLKPTRVAEWASSGLSDAPDAASSFLNLLEGRLRDDRSSVEPVLPQLLEVARAIASNQRLYDADVAIYGDFREQLKCIESRARP